MSRRHRENEKVHGRDPLAVDVAQQKIDDPRRAAALPLSRKVCQRAAQPSLPLDSPSRRPLCGAASKRRRPRPQPPPLAVGPAPPSCNVSNKLGEALRTAMLRIAR
mmetsp:Transcript_28328/g.86830  ORF Transcript_28328/g.86830 Transcript_28328/m.86830 type:complete len:106 (-) Transcript_28328:239-556(-)